MGDPVFLRGAPPWPFGAVARKRPRAILLYSGVDPTNLGSHEGKAYLLSMTPFDAALTLDLPAPPYPFGVMPRRRPRAITSQGRSVAIYPACTGNAERSTLPDDVPADIWIPGLLNASFNYELALFGGADPTTAGTATIGIIELQDPAGETDGLRTLGMDGAPLVLSRGEPGAPFSTYVTIAKLSAAGIRYDVRKKEILLRDLAWKLTQAELHGLRYDGTGDLGGDAHLAGIVMPYCIGQVLNISPVLFAAVLLGYQVSCSAVLAVDAVYDGRVPLDFAGDYPTWADLKAATILGGTYATCLAVGVFRVGSQPVFIITADVRGDDDLINGVGYPHTRAQIARRIATGRGNIVLADPTDIDGPAFEAVDQVQPAILGYFWNEEKTKADALTEVMAGCLGWWMVRLNGRLAIGQLEDPATQPATLTLSYPTDGNTVESRLDEPSMPEYKPPRRTTLMGWARNYTPLNTNQIAASVPPSESAVWQAETRYTTSDDPWVAAGYPTAAVVSVAGGFAFEDDAKREGDRQQRLLRKRPEPYEIPAVIDPFADVVGRVLTIANCGRIGLGVSRNLFCFGIAVNSNQKPVLRLLG